DDKALLKSFEIINNGVDSTTFIYHLLKYRILFDKYIIKQDLSDADESKRNWGIRKPNEAFEYTVKTFENDEELVKLQTMLYYSNPSSTNNNWVQEILKGNFKENPIDYARNVFDNIAKPRFSKDKLAYPYVTSYNLYF